MSFLPVQPSAVDGLSRWRLSRVQRFPRRVRRSITDEAIDEAGRLASGLAFTLWLLWQADRDCSHQGNG